jgi:iron complex transport system ATP-binding protein
MTLALLTAHGLAIPDRLQESALEIGSAGFTCLVGPNGSGKTSLLHALARIGRASGAVRIDGFDPDAVGPEERRRLLSYLPASRDIAWPLAARDVIALGLPAGADRHAIDASAAMLEVNGLLDRRIDRLSTGERSRVLIARALAPRPRLALLDEPAANLDPAWQLRLMEALKMVTTQDRAVIAAMHDLDLALRYADRLVLMEKGRIAAEGDPADLMPQLEQLFGVARGNTGWRLINRTADPRSSP